MTCHTCQRPLVTGESAWANDWTVADVEGDEVKWRVVTRYTCDDCEKTKRNQRT